MKLLTKAKTHASTLAASLLVASAFAQPADAMACLERSQMVNVLKDQHDEVQAGVGLQENTNLIEVYASPNTGTWTILMTQPTGVACIVAVGTNWLESDPVPAGVPG